MNRSTAFFIVLVFTCIPGIVFGQPGGGGPDNSVPISGIEILVAAGAALGLGRFFLNKNKNKE